MRISRPSRLGNFSSEVIQEPLPSKQESPLCATSRFTKTMSWTENPRKSRRRASSYIQFCVLDEGREWGVGSVVVGSAFGTPQIFAPNRSETLQNKGIGASGLKIGAPQKRGPNDHGSNAPSSALWFYQNDRFFFLDSRFQWQGFSKESHSIGEAILLGHAAFSGTNAGN